jgi:hypothetical protein
MREEGEEGLDGWENHHSHVNSHCATFPYYYLLFPLLLQSLTTTATTTTTTTATTTTNTYLLPPRHLQNLHSYTIWRGRILSPSEHIPNPKPSCASASLEKYIASGYFYDPHMFLFSVLVGRCHTATGILNQRMNRGPGGALPTSNRHRHRHATTVCTVCVYIHALFLTDRFLHENHLCRYAVRPAAFILVRIRTYFTLVSLTRMSLEQSRLVGWHV